MQHRSMRLLNDLWCLQAPIREVWPVAATIRWHGTMGTYVQWKPLLGGQGTHNSAWKCERQVS